MERFIRNEMLFGSDAIAILTRARVAIFGVGGVGGYVLEALVRSGIGEIAVIDSDRISVSNINRQILALDSTVGMLKVDAAEQRALSINPNVRIEKHPIFYLPETADELDLSRYDYVIDAIDTVSAKMEIIKRATSIGVPVISSMGTGNKLDPTRLEVSDIYKTSVCPLARVMRGLCRKAGIPSLKVVYSREEPTVPHIDSTIGADGEVKGMSGRIAPASCAFVPSVAGLIIASEVVRNIISASDAGKKI